MRSWQHSVTPSCRLLRPDCSLIRVWHMTDAAGRALRRSFYFKDTHKTNVPRKTPTAVKGTRISEAQAPEGRGGGVWTSAYGTYRQAPRLCSARIIFRGWRRRLGSGVSCHSGGIVSQNSLSLFQGLVLLRFRYVKPISSGGG
uniref:Uncharacterized protein n=1 Tax=Knipowitschia caucasica TaxID=637954 RepID=A0AAV2KIJ0_KNICA